MIDEDIMEKIIPIPDEEEEMENIEAELAEAELPDHELQKRRSVLSYHPDVCDIVYRAETACKDNLELLLHPPCTRRLA